MTAAAVLLSQIIQLGHAMHLEVVAEGVESEKEYAFLADNHCDLVQGYYLLGQTAQRASLKSCR
jgi:EAL domain-containing protein (putative c-di-GMP-specific phosphodiesterase class I)